MIASVLGVIILKEIIRRIVMSFVAFQGERAWSAVVVAPGFLLTLQRVVIRRLAGVVT